MPASVKLEYKEGDVLVEIETSPNKAVPFIHLDVFKGGTYIAAAQALTLEHARAIAHLIVGIEIQPDGAAWRRGPRPPAQPTDHEGNIIEEGHW